MKPSPLGMRPPRALPARADPFMADPLSMSVEPSTVSRLFERRFFFSFLRSSLIGELPSSGMGGGGGDDGITICLGLFLCDSPEAELLKLLIVLP